MPSTTEIKIRGYHVDFYGHVNNARYLELMEEARWVMFEEYIDFQEWSRKGWSFLIVNINIRYKRPAFLGETIEIRSGIARLDRKSGIVRQRTFLKGTDQVIADAEVTFVIADPTGKAMRMEEDLRALLDPLVVQEP